MVMLLIASMLFLVWPNLDTGTSALFFSNGHFLMEKKGLGSFFTVYLHVGMRCIFFVYAAQRLLVLLADRFRDSRRTRSYALIVASVAIAAGLVTNLILKDHWGRARPGQILLFGGDKVFTPAWIISNQCRTNCSFVGGDVSFAFCALAAALTVSRNRVVAIAASILFGTVVALGRIAAGAHFLSDCVISGLLTTLIVLILYRVIYRAGFP